MISILKIDGLEDYSRTAAVYSALVLLFIFIALCEIEIKNATTLPKDVLIEVATEPEKSLALAQKYAQAGSGTAIETHEAYNQKLVKKYAEETNYELGEDLENIKTLDELLKEQKDKMEQDFEAKAKGNLNVSPNQKTVPVREKHAEETVNTKSSVSYSLDSRTHIDLPTPIYTCPSEGIIVVNVVVASDGHVTKATIDKELSSSKNQCLWENALKYAKNALFENVNDKSNQKGTITYEFVAR